MNLHLMTLDTQKKAEVGSTYKSSGVSTRLWVRDGDGVRHLHRAVSRKREAMSSIHVTLIKCDIDFTTKGYLA